MEPERKIEKLLRMFVKKRREESGDSFDLHPATRRMLQAEAASRAQKPREETSGFFLRFFSGMKPSRVFAVFFFASLLISVCLLLPTLSAAKKKSTVGRMANNTTQSDKAPAPAPISAPALAVAESDARRALDKSEFDAASMREKAKIENLQTNVITVARTEGTAGANVDQKRSDEPIVASGTLAVKDEASTLALTPPASASMEKLSSNAPTLADARAPAASASKMDSLSAPGSPYTEKKVADLPVEIPNSAAAQRFVQSDLNQSVQNRFKNNVTQQNSAPVLANFELQQEGSQLSVRDEDGSVYKGYLVAASEDSKASAPARAQTRAASPRAQEQEASLNRNSNQSAQNYFFRVSGTNRSLRQNVVFSGNLTANSESQQVPAQNTARAFGGGGGAGGNYADKSKAGNQIQQLLKNQGQQSLFSNSRIAGTAVIGNTNHVEIDAVPVQ